MHIFRRDYESDILYRLCRLSCDGWFGSFVLHKLNPIHVSEEKRGAKKQTRPMRISIYINNRYEIKRIRRQRQQQLLNDQQKNSFDERAGTREPCFVVPFFIFAIESERASSHARTHAVLTQCVCFIPVGFNEIYEEEKYDIDYISAYNFMSAVVIVVSHFRVRVESMLQVDPFVYDLISFPLHFLHLSFVSP